MSNVEKTLIRAEEALKKLLSDNKKISQFSIEKLAGLANGALNYSHPDYESFKAKISKLKNNRSLNLDIENLKAELTKQKKLKKKNKDDNTKIKEKIKALLAENIELKYQLFALQKYVHFIEKNGIIDFDKK